MKSRFVGILSVLVCLPQIVAAADSDGHFSLKGAALTKCSRYVKAVEEKSNELYLYSGWVNGYITALNQVETDTYDLAPWQTSDFLAQALVNHCKQKPDDPFFQAVRGMLGRFKAQRLEAKSDLVEIDAGKYKMRYYQEVIKRFQEKLSTAGHFKGTADGQFTEETKTALKAFQEANDLYVSGLPDQFTLLKLFYAKDFKK